MFYYEDYRKTQFFEKKKISKMSITFSKSLKIFFCDAKLN